MKDLPKCCLTYYKKDWYKKACLGELLMSLLSDIISHLFIVEISS